MNTPHGMRRIMDQLADLIVETHELGWTPDEFLEVLEKATMLAKQRGSDER